MFAQGTFFKELFLRKILSILPICDNEKISTLIACTRNRFDFWNSCKRLQNFVNVEALPIVHPTIDSFDSLDSQANNITFVMVFQYIHILFIWANTVKTCETKIKQLFCNHFGCYMVIAGSNTFYMKIEDKTSSLLPAGLAVPLGDIYLTPYLTNTKVS